jgi:hypothetical protein
MLLSEIVQVLPLDESCPAVDVVAGEGQARAVAWPGVGARSRSMVHVRLAGGAGTRPLVHGMEAVYYVICGAGAVADGAGARQALVTGSMAFVEPATSYAFTADSGGMELVGGPCPADPDLFAGLKA